MKLLFFLFLLFTLSLLTSQENRNYLITLKKDTFFTTVLKFDKKMLNVICEEKGKKVKHEAKDLLAVKTDTSFFESGLVRLRKFKHKQSVFLQRTVKGNLSLYEISIKRTKFSGRVFGEDLVHFRWVYRAHDWIKGVYRTFYFYKKENESIEKLSQDWKEKTNDCKLFREKYNSKTESLPAIQREMVRFYNLNCK